MGEVIYLRPNSVVEFESIALRKLAEVTEMALRIPELLAAVQAETGDNPRRAAQRFIQLMSTLDEALGKLEEIGPGFAENMGPQDSAIFRMQCTLTQLRITAFATSRCSILYVNDFDMDGLDDALAELGYHRRKMLPPPA